MIQKVNSFEQYNQILLDFKRGRTRCETNKMMMREELEEMIDSGKLYYHLTDCTLWFLSDEDYFYSAHLYVPQDAPIQMAAQDKDVLVELMGSSNRYNEHMDRRLITAGFKRHDKYIEHGALFDDIIDDVRKQCRNTDVYLNRHEYVCRVATKNDYSEIRKLWMEKIGKESYHITAFTDLELETMERCGRWIVICDKNGKIQAVESYKRRNKTCYFNLMAANILSLGGCLDQKIKLQAYQEGCIKGYGWSKEDNSSTGSLSENTGFSETGKFYWQFVLKAMKA